MRVEQLLESEQTDRQQRQQAQQIYQQVVDVVVNTPLSQYGRVRLPHDEGLRLLSHQSNLDFDFVIAPPDPREPRAVGGFDKNSNTLVVYLNLSGDLERQMTSQTTRVTLIHEIVHFLDSKRSPMDAETARMDVDDYYNDPSEYNAYYQEAISQVENLITRLLSMGRTDIVQEKFGDFQSFRTRFYDSYLDSEFANYITEETKRRLDKRLYRFWVENVQSALTESMSVELKEMVYRGMIGFHELMMFMKKATERQKERFHQLLEMERKEEALQLMSLVLGQKVSLDSMTGG